jgi:hypothetical protein
MEILIPPIIGGAVNLGVQLWFCRSGKVGLLGSIVLGFVAGFAATLLAHALPGTTSLWSAAPANLVIYAAGGYTYFHLLNMGETARRVRLLRELAGAPDGLTTAELAARYNSAEMLARRLDRLVSQGVVRQENGRLYLEKRGVLVMTGMVGLFKRVVLGPEFRQRP